MAAGFATGTWPLGLLELSLAGERLSAAWLPRGSLRERLAAAALLSAGLATLGLRLLAGVGWLRPWEILAAGGAALALAALAAHRRGAAAIRPSGAERADLAALPALGVGLCAVGLAIGAAAILPIWQWDALGYHLTFVDLALQGGSLRAIPAELPYIGSYPHGVELLYLGQRALLPDDRLVDLAQLPIALLGGLAVALLAKRAGAPRGLALGAGALWLALPAVFLQLPTDYLDVASAAYFLLACEEALAPTTNESILLAGLGLGLFLGSKPTAPAAAGVLGLLLAARALRARRPLALAGAVACALVVGGESYLVDLFRWGNPIWPVALSLGPIQLPGRYSMGQLLGSGSEAPHLVGPLWSRLCRSWIALHPLPAFDMRVGGFGPLFLLAALPGAILSLARRPRLDWIVCLGASVATANPAIARYTFALPGLCLALAAAEAGRLPAAWRSAASGVAAALAALGLAWSVPGLTGNGPSLFAMARLSSRERLAALEPSGRAAAFDDLRRALGPGEAIAYDDSFELAHLLWNSEGSNRVLHVPASLAEAELGRWLERERVGALLAGMDSPAQRLARSRPARWIARFSCGGSESSCEVYSLAAAAGSVRSSAKSSASSSSSIRP